MSIASAPPAWEPPSAKDVRTSVAVRWEMRKIVKFVGNWLPAALTQIGRGDDLDASGGIRNTHPMEIPKSASADGGFKEPWVIRNSVNAIASKGLYEAAGCVPWINLELLEDARRAGGDEPTWGLVVYFAEHHFGLHKPSPPDGVSSADGVSSELPMIFPGILEGYASDLMDLEAAAKAESYPCLRVVAAQAVLYAWYYAMATRLRALSTMIPQTSTDLAVLWRCGRQVTLRVRVVKSTSDLAALGMEARGYD